MRRLPWSRDALVAAVHGDRLGRAALRGKEDLLLRVTLGVDDMRDPLVVERFDGEVKFDRAGGFAYVPNAAYMRDSPVEDSSFIPELRAEGDTFVFEDGPMTGFRAIRGGEFDAIRVVAELRAKVNRHLERMGFSWK
jgi:hypothetical protein